jgi:hypothetical protein
VTFLFQHGDPLERDDGKGMHSPIPGETSPVSVGRREGPRFLNLHLFVTANRNPFTRLCAQDFSTANLTSISFAQLCH